MYKLDRSNFCIHLAIAFFAFFITIGTYNAFGYPIDLDFDSSWVYAINYLWKFGALGTKSFITYGPLGFLHYTHPVHNNLLIASIFWLLARFIFYLTLLYIIVTYKKSYTAEMVLFFIFASLLVLTKLNIDYFFLFYTVINFLVLFNIEKKLNHLYYAAFIGVLFFFINPGYSLYANFAIFSYLIWYALVNKSYKELLYCSLAFVSLYVLFWMIINHTILGIINNLVVTYNLASANLNAMSLNPGNNWWFILGMFVFTIITMFFCRIDNLGEENAESIGKAAKKNILMPIIFILPLLAAFKYSHGRENGHIYFMFIYLTFLFTYFMIITDNYINFLKVGTMSSLALFFCYANQVNVGYKEVPLFFYLHFDGYKNVAYKIIFNDKYKADLLKKSAANFIPGKLAQKDLVRIGDSTVDIYPDNLAIAKANDLNLLPRPVLQSYLTYTPYLDNLNAEHFKNSSLSPDYIIWQPLTLDGLDSRYILNSEPYAMYEILKWYKPVDSNKKYVLLQRTSIPQLTDEKILFKQQVKWNNWIDVPKCESKEIRASLLIKTKLLEKIKLIFYKMDYVSIDYKLSDGSIHTHKLVVATARDGIWISPYASTIDELLKLKNSTNKTLTSNVTAIRIRHSSDDLFDENFEIIWQAFS